MSTTKSSKTVSNTKGNKNVSATKKIGRGLGSGLRAIGAAIVVVAEAEAERRREVDDIDRKITDLQTQRALLTGRLPVSKVTWSLSRPGHLVNCPVACNMRHCIDCGDRISGSYSVRCFSCR